MLLHNGGRKRDGKRVHCKYLSVVPYKTLEKFSKALYGTTGSTYSARVFRPVMKAFSQELNSFSTYVSTFVIFIFIFIFLPNEVKRTSAYETVRYISWCAGLNGKLILTKLRLKQQNRLILGKKILFDG